MVCLSVCLSEFSLFFSLPLWVWVSPSPPLSPDCASVLGTPWLWCCPRLSPARLAHCHHLFTEAGKIHSPAGGPSAPREGRWQTQEWASREREGQPWGTGLGGRQRRLGCVGMGISGCGQGLTGNPSRSQCHGKLLPLGHSSGDAHPPSIPPLPVVTRHTCLVQNIQPISLPPSCPVPSSPNSPCPQFCPPSPIFKLILKAH